MNHNRKVYMIGNAHLDPVWLWDWREGYAENNATMKSMIERLAEFNFVKFTSSSSLFYEWLEESSPEMFKKIVDLVHSGRWELCGGWYVQPDCNLPAGESFARQALYAQNFFHDKFGCISHIGYCVDSFGHAGSLPQLLQLSRMDKYVFMRPGRHEKDIKDNLFLWESRDGSQVVAYRIPFNYNAYFGVEKQIDDCMTEFIGEFPGIMVFYGVGNHGGGPTIENIKTILAKKNDYPDIEFIFTTPSVFFDDVEKAGIELPVVKDDLQHHASGCYSVLSKVKKENRTAENTLLRAEKFSCVAAFLMKIPYDIESFDRAWKNVLFNQFHDVLAGTCVMDAYCDISDLYGEAKAIASRLENRALQSISFNISIPKKDGSIPFVVFNPNGWDSICHIEIEGGHHKNIEFPKFPVLVDGNGEQIDFQYVMPQVQCRKRTRILFNAEIPAFGYRLFSLEPSPEKITATQNELDNTECCVLDNGILRCLFSKSDGCLTSIIHKSSGLEFLAGPSRFAVCRDTSDTWGHATLEYHEIEGFMKLQRIEKIESGPVRSVMRVVHTYGCSELVQDYCLYTDSEYMEIKCRVFWAEKLKCLRFDFPVDCVEPTAFYSIPYGAVEKKTNGQEEPMQTWFDIASSNDGKGIAIVNTSKYSGAVYDNVISLLVLRSPAYSHHLPSKLNMEMDRYDFIDQGMQYFEYAIIPHASLLDYSFLEKKGYEMNQKHRTILETYHDGVLPEIGRFIHLSRKDIIATALKKANIGEGYVLRLQDCDGNGGVCLVHVLGGREFSMNFGPYEIKSIRVDMNGNFIEEVDFLEWRKN